MRIASFALASLLLGLAACAAPTPYQPLGAGGGVAAQQLTADTFRILARGNGVTDPAAVEDYMLLKAAETTLAAGGTHFVLVTTTDATATSTTQGPTEIRTVVQGDTSVTTVDPGQSFTFVAPGRDAIIRVVTVRPGATPPEGAFDAAEIVAFVAPRVARPQ